MTDLLVSPSVSLVNGRPCVSSLKIAEHFGKPHRSVLRDIRATISRCPEEFNAHNFVLVKYTDAKGEERDAYDVYQDGFILVVMSYTGAKAMEIKLAYIMVFNAMRDELSGNAQKALLEAPDAPITPDQQCTLQAMVKALVEKGGIYAAVWSRFNNHFRIAKYSQLPQTRMSEAVDYLMRFEVTPRALPEPPKALPPARSEKDAARDHWLVAHRDFYSFQNAVSQPRTAFDGETRALKRHYGYATPENTALEVIEYLLALRVYLDGAITSATSVARRLTE